MLPILWISASGARKQEDCTHSGLLNGKYTSHQWNHLSLQQRFERGERLPRPPWRPQVTPEPTGSRGTFTDRNHGLQPITFFLRSGFISLPEDTIVNKKAGIDRFAKYAKRTPREDKSLLPHKSGMPGEAGACMRPTCSTRQQPPDGTTY